MLPITHKRICSWIDSISDGLNGECGMACVKKVFSYRLSTHALKHTMPIMTIINMIKLIHSGDNTHNQDQCITPVSFSAMNSTASNPANPIFILYLVDCC